MEDLRERVKRYISENNSNQAEVAKKSGINSGRLSAWLKGTYSGDNEKTEKDIKTFLEKEAAREQVTSVNDITFGMTGISAQIWGTLDYCRLQRQIVCIYGDAGCGKTYTACEWKKDKTDIIYLTGSPAFNSPKAFLKMLSRALKLKTTGNKDDLFFEIVDKLSGTDTTIIIDEAQHFNVNTIEIIRSVQEACRIGLALIGNAVVYNRLVGKQEAEFAQLFSRLMMRKHILTDQFKLEDVDKVFGKLPENEKKYLLQICRSRYGLRGAVFLYMNAINNDNTTENGLRAMAQEMGILV